MIIYSYYDENQNIVFTFNIKLIPPHTKFTEHDGLFC